MNLHQLLRRAERLTIVDRPAGAVAVAARRVLRRASLDRVLRGEWLGHPLHPVLVPLPMGAFLGAAVLDVLPGNEDAARRLVGAGLVALPPTVAAGLADYTDCDRRQRRTGVVHAAANAVAGACYAASYVCRRRGAHGQGALWGLLGMTALGAGGALGGHLAYAQGAGVGKWQSARQEQTAGDGRTPLTVAGT